MTTKDEAHEAVRTLLAYIEGIDAVIGEGCWTRPSAWSNPGKKSLQATLWMPAICFKQRLTQRGTKDSSLARHRIHINL